MAVNIPLKALVRLAAAVATLALMSCTKAPSAPASSNSMTLNPNGIESMTAM